MPLIIILFAISLIIFLINLFFLLSFPKFALMQSDSKNYLSISVIIAFKNEENNLINLFLSLQKLNYPMNKYEVILVDDNSSDNSYRKAAELSNSKTNYYVLKTENKKYSGKRGALDFGISKAKYPYILITDADCMPASNWLIGYSEKFNSGSDMLFGLAPFKQKAVLINKVSCFENLRSSILTFSFAKINLPYSAAARNFGFTISAFQKLGGFNNTLETSSGDDDLLLREAVKHDMKIDVVDLDNTFVLSNSKNTFGEYLHQKARHTKTSWYYLPIHQSLLGFWHSSNILMIFSLLLLPSNLLYGIPFLVKLFSDASLVFFIQQKSQYNFRLFEIPFLQLFYEVLLMVNFFSSFRKTIPWKN
jgi:cellulose synthase/poly-beta-1,6-N-acetylglucosamine synthase-like glycosyltransferase